MPKAGTQLNGKLSRRGRQSEGRPTKRTPEMVARIAKAISPELNDEETVGLVGIDRDTHLEWNKHPEFSALFAGQIPKTRGPAFREWMTPNRSH